MALGIYISVPFCKTKCSYCNFASGVFSRQVFAKYVDRVCEDIARAEKTSATLNASFEREVDSIYLGGGTPTLLEPTQLSRIFEAVRSAFDVADDSEITVECAPGTLSEEVIAGLLRCGVNRVSLGVQSFVDEESRSVARLHTRATVTEEVARLRAAGIANISIDLIAGLPHQTEASWRDSLRQVIDLAVSHASVYMLEVDEDSRLGRELIAGGTRYHAHFVPDEDLTADLYLRAVDELNAAGIAQYEISNFARPGCESRHNLKYWTRLPYIGFGVDAHSMLPACDTSQFEAQRFATSDNLEQYVAGVEPSPNEVTWNGAIEEAYFLGLRLTDGVDLSELAVRYGPAAASFHSEDVAEFYRDGLLELEDGRLRLTNRGRLLSNSVFERFINPQKVG